MSVDFQGWLNENSGRAYPFMEDTSLVSSDPTKELPLDTFLDLSVTTDTDLVTSRLQLVTVSGSSVTFSFLFGASTVAFTVVNDDIFPKRILTNVTTPINAQIYAVLGPGMASVAGWGAGSWTFAQAVLEPSTVSSEGQRAVKDIYDTLFPAVKIAGDVTVGNGRNMAVLFNPLQNSIRLTPSAGGGLGPSMDPISLACDDLIFAMGGSRPDTRGNILLLGSGNVAVVNDPVNHKIKICVQCLGNLCQTPP